MVKSLHCAFRYALALSAFAVITPSGAQDLKIGYVNIDRLVQESPQFEQTTAALQTEVARIESEIMTMQQRLTEKEAQLERDAAVLGGQERAALEREIRDLRRELERAVAQGQEEINVRQNEELNRLGQQALQKIQEYGRNEEYDVILRDVYYVDSDLDITEAVLETWE